MCSYLVDFTNLNSKVDSKQTDFGNSPYFDTSLAKFLVEANTVLTEWKTAAWSQRSEQMDTPRMRAYDYCVKAGRFLEQQQRKSCD